MTRPKTRRALAFVLWLCALAPLRCALPAAGKPDPLTVAQESGAVAQGPGTIGQESGSVAQGQGSVARGQGTVAQESGAVAQGPGTVAQEFIAALQRVHANVAEPEDSPALEAYVLHDYLVAARLRRDLPLKAGADLDSVIDDFLRQRGGQPVTRTLRHEWLASLASRARWDWFLARATDVTDPALICDRLAGRLATGDTPGLAADALARWLLPQQPPAQCSAVFGWLRSQGMLTPAQAESRTRAALSADNPRLAREFVVDVPDPMAAPLLQWLQLLEAPKAALGALAADPQVPVEPDALAAGFSRLSSSDYAAAAVLLPGLLKRPDTTEALRIKLRRTVALGAAYSRAPGALAAFAVLPDDPGDTQVEEWRVRAALWAGDFTKALHWIDDMPAALAETPRWRYWRARATDALSGATVAAPLYAEVAGLRDYYGYLAADRLGSAYNLNIHPSVDDLDLQATLGAEPGLRRAHALFDCDMVDDAAVEWAAVVANAKPAVKVQAAHLASRWGWYAETIATLAQAGEWDDVPLRYPRPFAAMVAEAAKRTGIAADWLFAVMRQESLFRPDAVSRADARGLMQMQPATATAVALRWHLPPVSRQNLFDPAIAIPLGAFYVRELLDKYHGQLPLSLAAYNAGPQALARWMPDHPVEADAWIENIPYTETRSYITHILEHIVAFAAMRDATPPRLGTLMLPIGADRLP